MEEHKPITTAIGLRKDNDDSNNNKPPPPQVSPGAPPRPTVEPLKQDTNPGVPWQAYATGGIFILRWALARWKEHWAKRPSPSEPFSEDPTADQHISSTNQTNKKMIILKSSDDETFEIEEEAANGSQTIRRFIENECADSAIPLPHITSEILAKVIEYLKEHVNDEETSDDDNSDDKKQTAEMEAFDKEFINVDNATLFDLIIAAYYLHIKGLMDLTAKALLPSSRRKERKGKGKERKGRERKRKEGRGRN